MCYLATSSGSASALLVQADFDNLYQLQHCHGKSKQGCQEKAAATATVPRTLGSESETNQPL